MNTRTLTNKELQVSIRRDRSTTEYLEIQGIKRNNIKNLSREDQKEVENFIGSKTITIWIRK
jgi:hypothetical protein